MTTTEKTCFKCEERKPLTDFYKHPKMADGRVNKCKKCNKKDVSKNYRDNIEHYKEYERSRTHLPHRVAARGCKQNGKIGLYCVVPGAQHQSAWGLRNPKKKKAHGKIANEIKTGRMKRESCEVCGEKKSQAHHDDYDKPLEVRWLCAKCHSAHHKEHF